MSDFWRHRTVFVTGATGLMGGWLVKRLLGKGAQVIALVRDGVPSNMLAREGILDRICRVSGSVEDFGLLRRALCEYAVDTVFHLAAQPLVGVAKRDPIGTLKTNVEGTWNLLEAARQADVRQIVVASSDKAYGASEHLPYTEIHPLQGRYPYDVSKSCADLICGMYAATYGTPLCVVRCANLFGGGDLNFSRTLPGAIQATLHGEPFIIRSDGKSVRDFLYVKDAATGYMRVAEALAADRELVGEAFNLSLEVKLTVLDCARKVLDILGRSDLEPIIRNEASAEIREQYLDSGKARRMLGWSPNFTFDEALGETIDWYRDFFGLDEVPRGEVALAATGGGAN